MDGSLVCCVGRERPIGDVSGVAVLLLLLLLCCYVVEIVVLVSLLFNVVVVLVDAFVPTLRQS